MSKSPQRRGIESRLGADGKERHRARGVRGTGRGPWRESLAAARSDQARLVSRRDAGAFEASSYPTFEDAALAWLDKCDAGEAWARGRKPYAAKTLRDYRRDLGLYAFPAFGPTPIDRLRRSTIQQLVDEVAALHTGQRARNVATPVMSLYRYLLGRFDDLGDPTHGLDLPSGSKPRTRIAGPAELFALIDATPVGDRIAWALSGLSGLRYGELRGLRRGAVGFAGPRPQIAVRWSVDDVAGDKEPKTTAGVRSVPVFAALLPYVIEHFELLGPGDADDLFIPGRRFGGYFSGAGVMQRAERAWAAAGLRRLTLHEFRHSFASNAVAAGYDVATVAAWLGHAQVSTTLDRYVKPTTEANVTDRMDAWLAANVSQNVSHALR